MSKRWFEWDELIECWELQHFELIDYCKKDLPLYDRSGWIVVNLDTIEHLSEQTYAEIKNDIYVKTYKEALKSIEKIDQHMRAQTETAHLFVYQGLENIIVLEEIEKKALSKYHAHLKEKASLPNECILKSFELPGDQEQAQIIVEEFRSYKIKTDDIVSFAQNNGLPHPIVEKPPSVPKNTEIENSQTMKLVADFIAKLKPQIERIWSKGVLKIGYGQGVTNTKEARRDMALNEYDKKPCQDIPRKVLENLKLYEYGGGKEKRNYVKRLLQSLKDAGLGSYTQGTLYDIYKKSPGNSTN